MGYQTLVQCLNDLEANGDLVRIDVPVDPHLEMGVIQRRAFRAKAPALLFTNVKGCSFPMVANVFGTRERIRFIFRDTLRAVEGILKLKVDPFRALKRPWDYLGVPRSLFNTLPKSVNTGPVMANETTISALPQLVSWPMDGGGYVTLPQVYSESQDAPGYQNSNLGMYRVQLTGEHFEKDREVGLHYQIHRGIGAHHAEAIRNGEPLKVNVFVGGPPAMTIAAVMPLPDGISELLFAGGLGGRRVSMIRQNGMLPMLAEADFCICGTINAKDKKPEGPFGDHIGYYSLAHDFPVMQVDKVYHRDGAVWPFTTVGRPPQEDTMFGEFIHELTSELVPTVFTGVHEVHAVDAAGVHPLLLAVGSERYVPYADERQPQELLTNAMALLGNTQTSLSKYVFIGAREDDPNLSAHNVQEFFKHILERVDLGRDLHFLTRTTIDTLDYSGTGLNEGSKLIVAACGPKKRNLGTQLPADFDLPSPFKDPYILAPGIIVVKGPKHGVARGRQDRRMQSFAKTLGEKQGLSEFPLVVVCDDSQFTATNWENFLWVTFTRTDPATDAYGGQSITNCKHWGCEGPLVLDARIKEFHAPALEMDPAIEKRVDELSSSGGPLHGIL